MISEMVIKAVLVSLLVGGAGAFGISKVKSWGYDKAHAECLASAAKYQTELNIKIESLITLSNTLALENRKNTTVLSADVDSILKEVRAKPVTIIKNGKCIPSPVVATSLININKRINESIKGKPQ